MYFFNDVNKAATFRVGYKSVMLFVAPMGIIRAIFIVIASYVGRMLIEIWHEQLQRALS